MARRSASCMTLLRQVPEMTGFRGLVYCRHYPSVQPRHFIAKPLGVSSDMVVVVCHKVIIEDVARLDSGHQPGLCTRQHLRHIYHSGGQPLSAQLVTRSCQQLNTTTLSLRFALSASDSLATYGTIQIRIVLYCIVLYRRGYLCYTLLTG